MGDGYIKLWRKLQDNPIWYLEKFTRGQAWVDLLMLASHKEHCFLKRGIKIKQPRGVVGVSVIGLADRWQWSRGKVQRFLDDLETEQQIEQQKSRLTTLIKIINYSVYQGDGTTERTTNGQQTDNKRTQSIMDKNGKERIRNNTPHNPPKGIVYPEWLNKKLWAEFKKHRVKLKKPMTERAEELAIGKLKKIMDRGYSQQEIIDNVILKGWQGIYPPPYEPEREEPEF